MIRVPGQIFGIIFCFAFFTGGIFYYQVSLDETVPPPVANGSGQVASDIQGAIAAAREASTEHDFATSGRTPEDVFSNLLALGKPELWSSACRAFEQLAPRDLAVFDRALRSERYEKKIPCLGALQTKLERFWNEERKLLSEMHPPAPVLPPALVREHVRTLKPGEVTLVIQGGPIPAHTPKFLAILGKHGIQADFVLSGKNCRAHPELVRKIAKRHHALGSQGMGSAPLDGIAIKDAEQSILDGLDAIEAASGVSSTLFGFPAQASTPQLLEFLRNEGFLNLSGSNTDAVEIDSKDWQLTSPLAIYEQVIRAVHSAPRQGLLIYFHENSTPALIALPFIVDQLLSEGLKPVSIG